MGAEIEIVRYHPELKSQVLELQTHLWSSDLTLNGAYFDWKYERNPYINRPLLYIALSGGKAVGMRGMFGTKWQIGSPTNTVIGLYADDLVIAPAYRNKGLIARIMKVALADPATQGYDFVFNLSAGPITFLASLAMGWRSIGSMEPVARMGKPLCLLPKARRLASRLPFVWRYADKFRFLYSIEERHPFRHLDKAVTKQAPTGSRNLSIEKSPQPERMANLVSRLSYDGRLRHVRDEEYFSWRFQSPLRKYRFIFWKETCLEGYMVLQSYGCESSGGGRVNIVDWEGTSLQIQTELLQVALHWGNFRELFSWTTTLSGEKKAILANAGFKPIQPQQGSKYRNCVIVRSVRDDMLDRDSIIANHKILDLANWDLRMIYSMHG